MAKETLNYRMEAWVKWARHAQVNARAFAHPMRWSPSGSVDNSWLAGLAIVLGLVLWFLFRDFYFPIVSDEVGYLSIAQYFAGVEERINLSVMPTYRFGQGLLLSVPFFFGASDALSYQFGVILNCVFTAVVPLVLVGIARRLEVEVTWNVAIAAFLATIFPANLYQVSLVWPEVSLRLFFLVSVYLFASAWVTQQRIYWILFAASVAWLFSLHARTIVIIPIALLSIIAGLFVRRASPSATVVSVFVLAALVFGVGALQSHIEETLWLQRESVVDLATSRLSRLFTAEGISRFVTVASGHAWSQLASTYAFVGLGFAVLCGFFMRGPTSRAVSIFVVLSIAAVFSASVGQMLAYSRVDHVIYSRYNDPVYTVPVWLGIAFGLDMASRNRALSLILLLLTVFTAYICTEFVESDRLSGIVVTNISALLWINGWFSLSELNVDQIILLGSFATVAVFASSVMARGKLGLIVLTFAVLAAGYYAQRNTWGAHNARRIFVEKAEPLYQDVEGTIYWDKSDISNLNIMFDQYKLGQYMPVSDLKETDIGSAAAAVVAQDFSKKGYSCIAKLPYGSKLVAAKPEEEKC